MKTLKLVGTYVAVPLMISAVSTVGFIVGAAVAGEVLDRVKKSKSKTSY